VITFGPAQWTPWLIAENLIATAVLVTALVRCWRSADRVVPENRTRTRIWRLFVASLGISIYGVWLPIGAVYALMAYTPKKQRPPSRVSRQTAAWLGVEPDE
jgi:hypothetical protein